MHNPDPIANLIALKVLPLVLELGQDIIWRVRRAVMVSVPLLTERMGVNYFEENLLELYLQVMTRPQQLYEASTFYCFSRAETPVRSCWYRYLCML